MAAWRIELITEVSEHSSPCLGLGVYGIIVRGSGGLELYEKVPCGLESREPVWPSGKALGWYAEEPRFDTASALLSLQKRLWFVATVL